MTKTKRNNECHLEFVQNKFAKRNNESNMNRAVDISSGSCQSIPIFATYSCLPCQFRISIIHKDSNKGSLDKHKHNCTQTEMVILIIERRIHATLHWRGQGHERSCCWGGDSVGPLLWTRLCVTCPQDICNKIKS